jgi:hypothetical protein
MGADNPIPEAQCEVAPSLHHNYIKPLVPAKFNLIQSRNFLFKITLEVLATRVKSQFPHGMTPISGLPHEEALRFLVEQGE